MKQIISTPNAPQPIGPYSQANVATGRAIYVAGQGGVDPATGKVVEGGVEAQAERVFQNLAAILQAAGASFKDVVKVNVYLSDMANFSKMNEVYRRYITADFPARTTVQAALPLGLLVEIDVVAFID